MKTEKKCENSSGAFASIDSILLLLAIAAANTHLIGGNLSAELVFLPHRFLSGDWWRLFTFPFVHMGWYHLCLDAGAFFLLYTGLPERRWPMRLLYMGVCSSASLAAVWLTTPEVQFLGLNGLSGIGHGLMALSTLEMAKTHEDSRIGIIGFVCLVSKSIYEVLTGTVLFHFGLCGTPLAACHAGGILGGIFVFALASIVKNFRCAGGARLRLST